MITKLHDKLAEIRSAREEGEKGFTLIELLVVVIIIGILAAIAIPIFLGQQQSAQDSAVQSDLRNAKTAVIAFQVDNPGVDVTIPSDGTTGALGEYGFTVSDFTTFTGATFDPATDWTITATSDTTNVFRITATGGVEPVTAP